ncbi:polysaccharide lyase family 8 super-sandwich domain-containing protein [Kitasatospora purpeofusca]|uniref:polysaccharide lyase family 8 super-sandwich domain-containing protein n=1 Tax=Kitasatospora purpeofusca TaxID=67352 RepID=UPI0036C5FE05
MDLSRRRFLLVSALGAAGAVVLPRLPAFAAGDQYDQLRDRMNALPALPAGTAPFTARLASLGTDAAATRTAMAPTTGSLWPDLPIGSVSANVTASFGRLRQMLDAYRYPGTGLTADNGLATAIVTGLDWMAANAYTPTGNSYDNWWDWQIGSPQASMTLTAALYDKLTPQQITTFTGAVDRFVPDSKVASYTASSTGANRVDLCRVYAMRGIVGKSSAKLALARDALSPVLPFVVSGEGLYRDGSFVQHYTVPYIGHYGLILFEGIAELLTLLKGSAWAVTDPNVQNVLGAVDTAIAPFVHNGLVMDSVAGRFIACGAPGLATNYDDHVRGQEAIMTVLALADATSDATSAARWRSMAKGWLQRDTYAPALDYPFTNLPRLAAFKEVLDDTSVTATPEPVGHRVFGPADRAVHRRAGWAFALAMSSRRTAFYEGNNNSTGQNLRGWHTGSGMTYVWQATSGGGQYSDQFWPTVNPYRLPGTTVSTKQLADGAGGGYPPQLPANSWAGGATDGEFAVLGQDTRGVQSSLTARKSWFCLADGVVCLGAGISASDGVAVESIVDNRNLGATGTNTLTVGGTDQPTTLGWSQSFANAGWANIAGTGGYVFLQNTTLKALREQRTGKWSDIAKYGPTDPQTRRYLTLWVDHGTNPSGAGYAYLLLPGASAAATAARATSPGITVIANTSSVQAVTDTATGVTAANFWAAGTAGPITVSAPCSVLVRESGGKLTVAVADPTREAATVTVTVNRNGYTSATGGPGISVLGLDPITVVAEVGGTLGGTRTITFGSGSAVTPVRSVLLPCTADAYIRDGSYADTNYGGDSQIVVKNSTTGYTRRGLLAFDISTVTATPKRAVLWVNGRTDETTDTQATLTAYGVTATWSEGSVTWNNRPALAGSLASAPVGDVADWIPFDVTSHIAARRAAGATTVTVGLAQDAADPLVTLTPRTGTAGDRPLLEILY